MALEIANHPRKTGGQAAAAYGWIHALSINFTTNFGVANMGIHESVADYAKPEIDQRVMQFGQIVVPESAPGAGDEVRISSLAELMQDPTFATAFNTVRDYLYDEFRKFPDLANATDVA